METSLICLGRKNRKTGRVLSFSLPSIVACPGSTQWCRKHCYARRYERLRRHCRDGYGANLKLALNPDQFVATMLEALPHRLPCFRIHVSGDFVNAAYALAWERICRSRPKTLFWAYTRVWMTPILGGVLESLRDLQNLQLFASLDVSMPLPPASWRIAFIENDPRATGMPCRHQHGLAASCLECGYCFRERDGNVVFKVH